MRFLRALLLGAPAVAIFKCNDINVGGQKYDLSALDYTTTESSVRDTPPSTTNTTWYINPCAAIENDLCPPNSQICGVQSVTVDGETRVTQIIPISSDDSGSAREASALRGQRQEGVLLEYHGAYWGGGPVSAVVTYECAEEDSIYSLEWVQMQGVLFLEMGTPAACAEGKSPKDGNGDEKDGDNGDDSDKKGGWGFFTWVFFLVILVFVAYAASTAYANYRRYGHARIELDSLAEVSRDLPYLIRDFVQKLMSTFGSGHSGYSAV